MTARRRVYGVTKCMECHKAFRAGDDVAEVVAQVRTMRATSVPGYRVGGGYHAETSRYHAECLKQVQAWIEKVRRDCEADRAAMVAALQAGIDQ